LEKLLSDIAHTIEPRKPFKIIVLCASDRVAVGLQVCSRDGDQRLDGAPGFKVITSVKSRRP
jgi:hypothetical protein